MQKILSNEEKSKEKSIILTFATALTMASLTNVIYIRMYALSTLNIMLTTYLHMKLLESEKINPKLLVFIGISATIGSLTHYYYLFYLAMMYIVFTIKYIRKKEFKKFGFYTLTMAIAAVISLLIFPFSIVHMFFGYRGQGVIDKFKDISMFIQNIVLYLVKVNNFCFNGIGVVIFILEICGCIYMKIKKRKIELNKFVKIIVPPTIFYFLLVAVASPWIELRYIMPICSIIFIIGIYFAYILLKNILSEKITNIIASVMRIVIMISPAIFKIEPEVMFSDKAEIVEKLSKEYNVPTLYVFYSENNRFLDDILLFSKIDNSYIAKDLEYTVENIKAIFEEKDTSKGVIVFINKDEENEKILEKLGDTLNLKNTKHLKRMNACNIYYIF